MFSDKLHLRTTAAPAERRGVLQVFSLPCNQTQPLVCPASVAARSRFTEGNVKTALSITLFSINEIIVWWKIGFMHRISIYNIITSFCSEKKQQTSLRQVQHFYVAL